ncbi:hypothetical protein DFS34DRAFT_639215 [Phlyctochytrium arcticum]|nr:hypothetical protein DFS34DRAFT_639215 [Phlyctochytrium arcticum]
MPPKTKRQCTSGVPTGPKRKKKPPNPPGNPTPLPESFANAGPNPRQSARKILLARIFNHQHPLAPIYLQRLLSFIKTVHELASHTTQFLRFFYTQHLHDVSLEPPKAEDMYAIFQLLNKGNAYNPTAPEMVAIKNRYIDTIPIYSALANFHQPQMKDDQQPSHYVGKSIFTNLRVNIQQNYYKMLLRFLNRRLDVKERVQHLKITNQRELLPAFYQRVRWLKSIATFDTVPTEEELDGLPVEEAAILDEIWSILPRRAIESADGIALDVVVEPLHYLQSYCKLAELYEQYQYPSFTAIPLRKSHIQSSIRIDTTILAKSILCLTRKQTGVLREGNRKYDLWSNCFRLESRVFQPQQSTGLEFDFSIATDGHAVSVHLQTPGFKYGTSAKRKSKAAIRAEIAATYCDQNLDTLGQAPNIVVIDPNKRDILFCRGVHGGGTMRYTANQRNKETRSKVIRKTSQSMRRDADIESLESAIPTHKTMNTNQFVEYLEYQANHRQELQAFYHRRFHRRSRFRCHSFTQKSEAELINRMRDKFGENFVVVLGDWDDAGRTARFQTSSKTAGSRKTFRQHHVQCFLLDEFKTSALCCRCHQPGHHQSVHGLLGCTNPDCIEQDWTADGNVGQRMRYYNRDGLSTLNMATIVRALLQTGVRPLPFQRGR